MPIDQRDYEYTVVLNDSLTVIAQKHAMVPSTEAGARLIWEHVNNNALHATGTMPNGTTVSRQIHKGNNQYRAFSQNNYDAQRDLDYNRLDQIILYGGEKIWIPNDRQREQQQQPNNDRIKKNITDEERKKGIIGGDGKKYEVKFPTFRIIFPKAKMFTLPLTQPSTGEATGKLNKDEAEFYLVGKDNSGATKYAKIIKLKDITINSADNNVFFDFIGMPTGDDIKYSLIVRPGKSETGNERDAYEEFKGVKYSEKAVNQPEQRATHNLQFNNSSDMLLGARIKAQHYNIEGAKQGLDVVAGSWDQATTAEKVHQLSLDKIPLYPTYDPKNTKNTNTSKDTNIKFTSTDANRVIANRNPQTYDASKLMVSGEDSSDYKNYEFDLIAGLLHNNNYYGQAIGLHFKRTHTYRGKDWDTFKPSSHVDFMPNDYAYTEKMSFKIFIFAKMKIGTNAAGVYEIMPDGSKRPSTVAEYTNRAATAFISGTNPLIPGLQQYYIYMEQDENDLAKFAIVSVYIDGDKHCL